MHKSITWIRGEEQLNWLEKIIDLREKIWPDYQRLERTTIATLYANYSDYQWLAYVQDEVVGIINSLPVFFHQSLEHLPDTGLDWILSQLNKDPKNEANYLAAISVTVNPAFQNQGVSQQLLLRLKSCAQTAKYQALLVPARPSSKEYYPLIAMDDYLDWRRADNTHFDPWLRTHEKLGGTVIKSCKQSRSIKAAVRKWEQWLNRTLPQSGHYLINGGLNPLWVNVEEDVGVYMEPNIWVAYAF